MMTIRPLLEEALEAAVTVHFEKLFGELMADPGKVSLEHFRTRVRKLIEMEAAVTKLIKHDLESEL